jgi:hypothetical protein
MISYKLNVGFRFLTDFRNVFLQTKLQLGWDYGSSKETIRPGVRQGKNYSQRIPLNSAYLWRSKAIIILQLRYNNILTVMSILKIYRTVMSILLRGDYSPVVIVRR